MPILSEKAGNARLSRLPTHSVSQVLEHQNDHRPEKPDRDKSRDGKRYGFFLSHE
jgi:hypothetical protein